MSIGGKKNEIEAERCELEVLRYDISVRRNESSI